MLKNMEIDTYLFGKRLGELCKERNLTVKDLHASIRDYCITHKFKKAPGLSTSYTWFTGKNRPPDEIVTVIAEILGVSCDYLAGKSNDEDRTNEEEVYVDLSALPQECLKGVKAVESTVVMPTGEKMRLIQVRDSIALPERIERC